MMKKKKKYYAIEFEIKSKRINWIWSIPQKRDIFFWFRT